MFVGNFFADRNIKQMEARKATKIREVVATDLSADSRCLRVYQDPTTLSFLGVFIASARCSWAMRGC